MNRSIVLALVLALGATAGCAEDTTPADTPAPAPAAGMCKHRIADADCPFCHKELVAKLGECKEHNVAEALCWQCKPSLATAYKMEGDWCGEHGLPESKCTLCNPK